MVLDGDTVHNMAFSSMFDTTRPEFAYPALVYRVIRSGWNNYIPMPFRSSAKVVVRKKWGAFYQIEYSSFAAGTVVPHYTKSESQSYIDTLTKINNYLRGLAVAGNPIGARAGDPTAIDTTVTIPSYTGAGDIRLIRRTGAAAIKSIRMRLTGFSSATPRDTQRLKLLGINPIMSTDSSVVYQVDGTLGGFFGLGPYYTPNAGFPNGCTDTGGMYSYFYRPYSKDFNLALVNFSPTPSTIRVWIEIDSLRSPIASYNRFHSKYHKSSSNPYPMRGVERNGAYQYDYVLARAIGPGRFVGTSLHMYLPTYARSYSEPSTYPHFAYYPWYGEGCERPYINQDTVPLMGGVGTEGYFNFGWSSGRTFNNAAYASILTNEYNNWKGTIVGNRYHFTDARIFSDSIRECIQKTYSETYANYATTAMWYSPVENLDDGYPGVSYAGKVDYCTTFTQLDTIKEWENSFVSVPYSGSDTTTWVPPMVRVASWAGSSGGNIVIADDTINYANPSKSVWEFKPKAQYTRAKLYYATAPLTCKIKVYHGQTLLLDTTDTYSAGTGISSVQLNNLPKQADGYYAIRVESVGWNPASSNNGVRHVWGLDKIDWTCEAQTLTRPATFTGAAYDQLVIPAPTWGTYEPDSITAVTVLPTGLTITKTGANKGMITGRVTTIQAVAGYQLKAWGCGTATCWDSIAIVNRPLIVSPSKTDTAALKPITIYGSSFGASRTGPAAVTLCATAPSSYTSWSDTLIVVVAEKRAENVGDVAVTNPSAVVQTLSNGFQYVNKLQTRIQQFFGKIGSYFSRPATR
jgi:hypothetical protein